MRIFNVQWTEAEMQALLSIINRTTFQGTEAENVVALKQKVFQYLNRPESELEGEKKKGKP